MVEHSLESTRINIVYHGPAVAGKTANLLYLHANLTYERKGELHSEVLQETEERRIFFDIRIPETRMMKRIISQIRLQCVPGCVFYAQSYQNLLLEADAVVFVVDSQRDRLDANDESLDDMIHILQQRGLFLKEFPCALQYNKRDLPNILSIQELERQLNHVHAPYFEAVASKGIGVIETFQWIMNRIGHHDK